MWNWSQESKIVLITDSGCDVHSICLPLASPPLRGLLYCRAFFFRLESSLSRKLVTLNGLFADFFTYGLSTKVMVLFSKLRVEFQGVSIVVEEVM